MSESNDNSDGGGVRRKGAARDEAQNVKRGDDDRPDEIVIEVPIPQDDPRRDFIGMWLDLEDEVGAGIVEESLIDALQQDMANLIPQMYNSREELAQQVQAQQQQQQGQ